MALLCPHLRQGAGDGYIPCQSLGGRDGMLLVGLFTGFSVALLPRMQLNFAGLLLAVA